MRFRKKFIFFITVLIFLFNSSPKDSLAQEDGITLKGKVLSVFRKKPLDFATITVFEIRKKTYSQKDGSYSVSLPRPGRYTIRITSPGLKPLQLTLNITKDTKKNFVLQATRITGGALTITAERDIQKISRHTLNVQDLKDTPATLGDPLNALTTLPGVNRTFGFFGFLVMRSMAGSMPSSNFYLIDGLPMLYPQHFGAIHSVIALDFIREIDLFSSAFPAEYGHAMGAIISFNTIDEIKEDGGFTSINVISSNIEYHRVIGKAGYIVAAGRMGYLSLLVPAITRLMGSEFTQLPDYYDYQFKLKQFLDDKADHSLTFLSLGASDKWVVKSSTTKEENPDLPEEVDPFNLDWDFDYKTSFHTQGLFYTFNPGKKFRLQQIIFSSFNKYDTYVANKSLPSEIKDMGTESFQNIYGFKNNFKWHWLKDIAVFKGGLELILYDFDADVDDIVPTEASDFSIDIFQSGKVKLMTTNFNLFNQGYAAFIENKFTFNSLEITPGIRFDYLRGGGKGVYDGIAIEDKYKLDPTYDLRGLISYRFPTETEISIAGGSYNSYVQANPFWFQMAPAAVGGYYIEPESAIHRVAGIEQKIHLTTFRLEGFYNDMTNMVITDQRDPNRLTKWNTPMVTRNSGHGYSRGLEIIIKRDRHKGRDGFYGWISYAYTRSNFNHGLPELFVSGSDYIQAGLINPIDNYGNDKTVQEIQAEADKLNRADNEFFPNYHEIVHYIKLVAGLALGNHNFGLRYEFNTGSPYSPIIGDDGGVAYDPGNPAKIRYGPVQGQKNSKRNDPQHRLDLRYAYKTSYEWGYVSWYVEAIYITNTVKQESWTYNKPFGAEGLNPKYEKPDRTMPFMPIFGVEIKF